MNATRVFDFEHYEHLNRARGDVVSRLISEFKEPLDLQTAIDVGCGVGYFSGFLQSFGLQVTAVDGRQENVEEAQRRNPKVRFAKFDAQDPAIRSLGQFDLVFCFGLLYHLENPLLAIRHLYNMTGKLLLVEGVILAGEEPMMALIDEETHEDQGLNHIAFYPTESCLVKMLYRAGYSSVFRFSQQPQHPHYYASSQGLRVRTILAASKDPIESIQLVRAAETASQIRPWDPTSGLKVGDAVQKLKRFAEKPMEEKVKSLKRIIKAR